MALEREMETFARQLPDLLKDPQNQGQFALVRGNEVAGIFPTFDAALSVGYDKYQLDPFLVKEVTERELPRYFSRSLKCHS
jgi:hypothetical protein